MKSADKKPEKNNPKILELDYMRFIACIAVMVLHISAIGVTEYEHGSFSHIGMVILNGSLKFVVPLFIFLSGFTSFYGYKNKEFNYFKYLKKRLSNVLIYYIVWCLIYYLAFITIDYYDFDIIFLIKSILLGTMSYHMYYVVIIVQLYIIGPIFYKLLEQSDKKFSILFFSAVLTIACIEFIRFEYSDRLFVKYMFFYMFGIYVNLEYDKYVSWLKKNSVFVIISFIVANIIFILVDFNKLSVYSYMWFIYSVISIFFVYYICTILKSKLNKIYGSVEVFNQSSYNIYLMHPLVLDVMMFLTKNYGITSVTTRLLLYFTVVIPVTSIACITYTVIRKKLL